MADLIRNIALDTSFIEKKNFLRGNALHDLADLIKRKLANLYLTDIVFREVKARFKTRIITEAEKTRQVRNQLKSLAALKNSDEHQGYFDLPEVDVDTICSTFNEKFDRFISTAGIEIIPTLDLKVATIFDDYFSAKPPFSEKSEKKTEFPDAFNFLALHQYFETRGEQCYLVSGDKDFDDTDSSFIIPVKETKEIISAILIEAEEAKKSKIIKLIEQAFADDKIKLQKDAHTMISELIEEEVNSRDSLGEMDVDVLEKIDLSEINITDYDIVYIGKGGARLECAASFSYKLEIAVEDKSGAYYDKEDDIWHMTEFMTIGIEDEKTVTLTVLVDFDDDDPKYANLELEDIDWGKNFDIFYRWDDEY